MDGTPQEIPLKFKYRTNKPKGKYRADYMGNSGINRHKGLLRPMVPGSRRKRLRRKII